MRRWRRRASGGLSRALFMAAAGAGLGWLLGAGRARAGERTGQDAKRAHAREQRRAARADERGREERSDRAAHVGGWHPEPEVVEVKSPAELEPGVAHASPEPTFENRVDRGTHEPAAPAKRRRRRRTGGSAREAPRVAAEGADEVRQPGSADARMDPGYRAPDVGTGVRESDLGAVPGPDADRGDGEDEAAARREPDDAGP